jgi:hypothetical protein
VRFQLHKYLYIEVARALNTLTIPVVAASSISNLLNRVVVIGVDRVIDVLLFLLDLLGL